MSTENKLIKLEATLISMGLEKEAGEVNKFIKNAFGIGSSNRQKIRQLRRALRRGDDNKVKQIIGSLNIVPKVKEHFNKLIELAKTDRSKRKMLIQQIKAAIRKVQSGQTFGLNEVIRDAVKENENLNEPSKDIVGGDSASRPLAQQSSVEKEEESTGYTPKSEKELQKIYEPWESSELTKELKEKAEEKSKPKEGDVYRESVSSLNYLFGKPIFPNKKEDSIGIHIDDHYVAFLYSEKKDNNVEIKIDFYTYDDIRPQVQSPVRTRQLKKLVNSTEFKEFLLGKFNIVGFYGYNNFISVKIYKDGKLFDQTEKIAYVIFDEETIGDYSIDYVSPELPEYYVNLNNMFDYLDKGVVAGERMIINPGKESYKIKQVKYNKSGLKIHLHNT